jgi:hypothetical protein
MMPDRRDFESFVRAVEALEPFHEDLVFVGGWAHYLYTLRPEASPITFEPLRTEDADIATPAQLRRSAPTIAERLFDAGFKEFLSSEHTPPVAEYVLGEEHGGFYLEFLAPLVGGEIKRGGRRSVATMVGGVTAQTLRYLDLLLTLPWQVTLDRQHGFPLARPRIIFIPNVAAYIVQKMLVLPKRKPEKQAKDLLYVHDSAGSLRHSSCPCSYRPPSAREQGAKDAKEQGTQKEPASADHRHRSGGTELPHVRIINSIRIRPDDLEAFLRVAGQPES